MLSEPRLPCPTRLATAKASFRSVMATCSIGSRAWPASVSFTPCASRSKSGVPSSLFEVGDELGDGRPRDMQPFGRPAEMFFFGGGDEIAQMSKLHGDAHVRPAWHSIPDGRTCEAPCPQTLSPCFGRACPAQVLRCGPWKLSVSGAAWAQRGHQRVHRRQAFALLLHDHRVDLELLRRPALARNMSPKRTAARASASTSAAGLPRKPCSSVHSFSLRSAASTCSSDTGSAR